MAKRKYDNTDPAILKRAIAGAIITRVEEIIKGGDYDNEDIRLFVARFFTDMELIETYQYLIMKANKKGVKLWDSEDFREIFKADLTTQLNRAIWELGDSFVVLAVLFGGYEAKKYKDINEAPSLTEIFGEGGK